MKQIGDREVRQLAAISARLEGDYESTNDAWIGSPFAWILKRPSRQKGAIGEKLVASWLKEHRFKVTRSPDTEADLCVEGRRTEIKFSTLWRNGSYKFQQIRDQNYEFLICLGIAPFKAHCWVLTKDEILHRWQVTGDLSSQHAGVEGTDTAWLTVNPDNVQNWLRQRGGSLTDGLKRISEITMAGDST